MEHSYISLTTELQLCIRRNAMTRNLYIYTVSKLLIMKMIELFDKLLNEFSI